MERTQVKTRWLDGEKVHLEWDRLADADLTASSARRGEFITRPGRPDTMDKKTVDDFVKTLE